MHGIWYIWLIYICTEDSLTCKWGFNKTSFCMILQCLEALISVFKLFNHSEIWDKSQNFQNHYKALLWKGWTLIQVMTCHSLNAKHLSKPCNYADTLLLKPQEQISVKSESKFKTLIQANAFANGVHKMSSILSKFQCVDYCSKGEC